MRRSDRIFSCSTKVILIEGVPRFMQAVIASQYLYHEKVDDNIHNDELSRHTCSLVERFQFLPVS